MWGALGLVLALFTAQFAWRRSLRETVNFYASDVYGLSRSTHRRYALASLLFACAFGAGVLWPPLPTVPLLAVYVLVVIFYFSSFARGFSDEER